MIEEKPPAGPAPSGRKLNEEALFIACFLAALIVAGFLFSGDHDGAAQGATASVSEFASPTLPAGAFAQSAASAADSYVAVHGSDACTSDCSGHDAGYQWAEDNDIQDVSGCDGRSDSFNEGCEAYVEDHTAQDDPSEDPGG
jgi:hypothetical protein